MLKRSRSILRFYPYGGKLMPDILFLCHRIPYPPNKGEKIRAYRFFEHLTRSHRVHLGCFVDDPDDVRHEAHLSAMATSTHFTHVSPQLAKARSMLGLLSGMPLSVMAFRHPDMFTWVAATIARVKPSIAFLYSSAMAQYILDIAMPRIQTVMDFVDVDSDKWRQYAETASWPLSALIVGKQRHCCGMIGAWRLRCRRAY